MKTYCEVCGRQTYGSTTVPMKPGATCMRRWSVAGDDACDALAAELERGEKR